MLPEKQIAALAELDGWKVEYYYIDGIDCTRLIAPNGIEDDSTSGKARLENFNLPAYLTSYDAITPLIQKQLERVSMYDKFQTACAEIQPPCECGRHWSAWMMRLTPAQLCEALLRATGRWTE